jgi:type IV pilus assembly protein PilA
VRLSDVHRPGPRRRRIWYRIEIGTSPRAAAGPGAVLVTQPTGHGPSEAILSKWKIGTAGEALAYGDLGALFRADLIHGLVVGSLSMARDAVTPEVADCIIQWSSAVREAVAWVDHDDGLAVITFDRSWLKTPIDTCIQTLGGLPRAQVAGARESYAFEKEVMAVLPDTVIIGTRTLVEASLSNSHPSEWSKQVVLGPEQQLAFIGSDKKEQFDLKGDLSVTSRRFSAHVEIVFPDQATAKKAAQELSPARLTQELLAVSPQANSVANLIADCWHVQEDGRAVCFEFTLNGDMKAMAERMGMAAALGIYGIRKYLAEAKAVEARNTVGRIAKDIVVSETSKNARPGKLVSLPAVPAQFERVQGKKYQSTSADWAKWSRTKFTLDSPQHYQYRVQAAQNGKSAEVIAEGDLDGNGKRSRFSLTIRLDPKTHAFIADPAIKEQDPGE